ncbi:MAG TPA: hypothetical protein VG675_25275 [Bryobacteraceae bacterium]|nr:hypothetical protein [Bryobacteraceae bacterium]
MCDYSLMGVPNRLAQEGEELVIYRFQTGSLGLAAAADLQRSDSPVVPSRTFWAALKELFNPKPDQVCAICIPPGARLELRGLPVGRQRELAVGPIEEVTFTQISALVNTYRDAVRFSNGRELRLQELQEGLQMKVLDLSLAEELDLDLLRKQQGEFQQSRQRTTIAESL